MNTARHHCPFFLVDLASVINRIYDAMVRIYLHTVASSHKKSNHHEVLLCYCGSNAASHGGSAAAANGQDVFVLRSAIRACEIGSDHK